jgi:hypothetical protein
MSGQHGIAELTGRAAPGRRPTARARVFSSAPSRMMAVTPSLGISIFPSTLRSTAGSFFSRGASTMCPRLFRDCGNGRTERHHRPDRRWGQAFVLRLWGQAFGMRFLRTEECSILLGLIVPTIERCRRGRRRVERSPRPRGPALPGEATSTRISSPRRCGRSGTSAPRHCSRPRSARSAPLPAVCGISIGVVSAVCTGCAEVIGAIVPSVPAQSWPQVRVRRRAR